MKYKTDIRAAIHQKHNLWKNAKLTVLIKQKKTFKTEKMFGKFGKNEESSRVANGDVDIRKFEDCRAQLSLEIGAQYKQLY